MTPVCSWDTLVILSGRLLEATGRTPESHVRDVQYLNCSGRRSTTQGNELGIPTAMAIKLPLVVQGPVFLLSLQMKVITGMINSGCRIEYPGM